MGRTQAEPVLQKYCKQFVAQTPVSYKMSLDILYSKSPFYAGETLYGVVTLNLSEPLKAKSIRLEINGRAQTHWTENEVPYSAQEIYIQKGFILWRGDVLTKGSYEFAFQAQIPNHAPSNFAAQSKGEIIYYCQASLAAENLSQVLLKTVKPFSVVGQVDLNSKLSDPEPLTQEDKITLPGTCCIKTGTISLLARLPRGGYVPGESIEIKTAISNRSRKQIRRVEVKLFQMTQLWGHRNGNVSADVKNCLKKAALETLSFNLGLAAHKNLEWTGEVTVPGLPPTLGTSRIIELWYGIQVRLVPHGMKGRDGVTVWFPIIIGTVPLRGLKRVTPPPIQKVQFNPKLHSDDEPLAVYEECMLRMNSVQ